VNTILAAGQIVVSIGLVAFVLLQARGAGLSSAFGGDSSVYRSRRGIEKTLFRFTIVLAIVFVVFSLIAFKLSPTA
jgi:preprotein translocase subunit SecG